MEVEGIDKVSANAIAEAVKRLSRRMLRYVRQEILY